MTTKLGRYIFKRIGGRVIPIRIGAEAKTVANMTVYGKSAISSSAIKKVKLLQEHGNAIIKKSALFKKVSSSTFKIKLKDIGSHLKSAQLSRISKLLNRK